MSKVRNELIINIFVEKYSVRADFDYLRPSREKINRLRNVKQCRYLVIGSSYISSNNNITRRLKLF